MSASPENNFQPRANGAALAVVVRAAGDRVNLAREAAITARAWKTSA